MKSIFRFVLIVVILIGLSLAYAPVAKAQVAWSHKFDFTQNTLFDWQPVYSGETPLAHPSSDGVYGTCLSPSVHDQIHLDTTVVINTQVSIHLWYEQDANHPVYLLWLLDEVEVAGGSYNASGTTGDITFNFSGQSGGYDEILVMADQSGCTGDYFIKDITFSGTSETGEDPFASPRYRPLRDDVTYEVNHVDGYGPIVDDVFTEKNAQVYNSLDGQVVAIETSGNGYMVKVVADDDTYTLYNNLGAVYPSLNDIIPAGCVIGTAGESFKQPSQVYTQNPGLLWFYPGTDFYVATNNEYIDWQNEWVEPPAAGVPCGNDLRSDNCLNYNPSLNDEARGWILYQVDDTDVNLSSVKLAHYGATVAQYVVLDHEVDYYVTLQTRIYHPYDWYSVIVMKGTDYTVIDTLTQAIDMVDLGLQNGDPVITQVGPLDLSDYDVNDVYLIVVSAANSNTAGINVDDVCVHDGSATVSHSPCYFTNNEFDQGSTGWTTSETGATFSAGLRPLDFDQDVILEPGAWISQPISLESYDGEDAIYDLDIKAMAVIGEGTITNIFDGDDNVLSITVETGVATIGTNTVNNLLFTLSHTQEITVADSTTLIGDLTITSDGDNPADINISSVCLSPRRGYWPGDEPDIVEEGREECRACAMPTQLDALALNLWLAWIWCNINRFIWCTLAVWIAGLLQTASKALMAIGLIGRYMSVVASTAAIWLLDTIQAIGSALVDGFLYALSVLWNFIAGLDLLSLLYDVLGYFLWAILRLLGLARVGIAAAITFFNSLLYLAHLMLVFAAAILTGLSGTPTSISLPDCTGTLTGISDGYCFVMTMTDGIIIEFPALTFGWVVVAAICGALTAMWTLDQLGEAFKDI